MNRAIALVVVGALSVSCKMSCFAPAARTVDAPIAAKVNAPAVATAPATTGPPVKPASFDHSTFDGLLKRFARPDLGRVDYAGLAGERAKLDAYVVSLAHAPLARLPIREREALLINAYNAFTLTLILDHYPGVASIKDLDAPWKTKRYQLASETVSLDDIEHGLLRPTYKDPRIHFAVNCASIGCPPLADHAYVGARLDTQLDEAARATLGNPRYARVEGGKLFVTSLLNWYGDDFVAPDWTPHATSIVEFVRRYRDDVPPEATVEFLDYDWRLNDVDR